MPYYLGFDSSTQSLSAIIIEIAPDGSRRVAFDKSLRFDEDFPSYGTVNGVLRGDDTRVAVSSPVLFADALDAMMGEIAASGLDLTEIRAIAGSGQQHGSVYLRAAAQEAVGAFDPAFGLAEQMPTLLSRPVAPIWMDSSTSTQCAEIAASVGGNQALAQLTGSSAFERFTGPQIRKFLQEEPEAYAATDRIHLVSSYLCTLLAGQHAPIDTGDGAGMNLMDIGEKTWARAALDATAPGLERKLPPVAESWTVVGALSNYWVQRHGFSPSTSVVTWSGDNPCSLIGVGLVETGQIAISLGTSDTLFGFMPSPRVDTEGRGHVFGSPTGDYMSLICFKNGSLARERVRAEAAVSWDEFSAVLRRTPPGNGGGILLPWFEPEITPHVAEAGARRYCLEESDHERNIRAVVEAQIMATAVHSEWMGVETTTIYATGGAACNREILQIMADVHDAEVLQLEVGNSACLGAALRAFHADEVAAGRSIEWSEVIQSFVEPLRDGRCEPDRDAADLYKEIRGLYARCEAHALGRGEDPSAALGRISTR